MFYAGIFKNAKGAYSPGLSPQTDIAIIMNG
jgi:hypothetical protein